MLRAPFNLLRHPAIAIPAKICKLSRWENILDNSGGRFPAVAILGWWGEINKNNVSASRSQK